MAGPATGKARPPTVDSFTGGTSRRLVRAERRERRPGRSATHEPVDSCMTAQFLVAYLPLMCLRACVRVSVCLSAGCHRCSYMNGKCHESARCHEPSDCSADVTCTCLPGFAGDGLTCTGTLSHSVSQCYSGPSYKFTSGSTECRVRTS